MNTTNYTILAAGIAALVLTTTHAEARPLRSGHTQRAACPQAFRQHFQNRPTIGRSPDGLQRFAERGSGYGQAQYRYNRHSRRDQQTLLTGMSDESSRPAMGSPSRAPLNDSSDGWGIAADAPIPSATPSQPKAKKQSLGKTIENDVISTGVGLAGKAILGLFGL